MLEKVNMKRTALKTTALRGDAGFTAIEIAMVAAVIAILSLIALPLFRNRVEEAKTAAAQADLNALMKAEQVVKADIDAYVRLEDLDNVELLGYDGIPPGGINKEVPAFKYLKPSATVSPDPNSRRVLDDAQRRLLAGTAERPVWRGPYLAYQNSLNYEDILNDGTLSGKYLANQPTGDPQKPIQNITSGDFPDHPENRIPVDPWGNPYLFFPPNGNAAVPGGASGSYSSAAIYSMGPNGQPGDGTQAANNAAYTRAYAVNNPTDDGALGKDDDIMVEF